ncbi:glycoprotein UL22A [Cercopithecine betaherpesvirus 5]|uniref:Glycoprotein UL22A n=1 Tax=Simian cytomegalovirus (strain Colburn) TaxID=50292 RepID=G8XT94_SCMVC|nr:glycoprotein UL22A [Cercopithecine betaherpesvirus 5]AEV80387.1 glycoprotein UL22A [Cercopithecine betaherpesvirus 5]
MRNLQLIATLLVIGLVAVHAIPRRTTDENKKTTSTDLSNQTDDGTGFSSTYHGPLTRNDSQEGSGDSSGEGSGEGSAEEDAEYDVLIEGELNDDDSQNNSGESSEDDSSAED